MDCNDAVGASLDFLVPKGEEDSTLGLAFIDPTGFQIRFDSVECLTKRARFDLLITFMTSFPRRFITQLAFGSESPFAAFIGHRAYQRHLQGRSEIGTDELLEVYRKQLRSIGYEYVDDITRILNTRGATIYHSVFASRNQRGKEFFEKISQRTSSGQLRMW